VGTLKRRLGGEKTCTYQIGWEKGIDESTDRNLLKRVRKKKKGVQTVLGKDREFSLVYKQRKKRRKCTGEAMKKKKRV